jgi:uncharacterized protein with ATP-grasp and redox domains
LDVCAGGYYEKLRTKILEKGEDEKETLKSLIICSGAMNLFDLSNPGTLQRIATELGIEIDLAQMFVADGNFERLMDMAVKRAILFFDEFDKFYELLEQNIQGTVLYFLDNHGEVIMDQLVIEQILRLSGQYNVVVVGRKETVREDVTYEEARKIINSNQHLKSFVDAGRLRVITDGSYCLGADLRQALGQPDFIKAWSDSFVFVAKGGGNFQSLFGQQLSRPGFFVRMMKADVNGLSYRLLSKVRQVRFKEEEVSPYNMAFLFQPKSQMYDIRSTLERKFLKVKEKTGNNLSFPSNGDELTALIETSTLVSDNYSGFDIWQVGNNWGVIPPEKIIRQQVERLEAGIYSGSFSLEKTDCKINKILDALALGKISIYGEAVDVLSDASQSARVVGELTEVCGSFA